MSKADSQSIVEEINIFLQKELWFDFEVICYQDRKLTIIGSIDPSSHHNIEIYFEDIFFVSLPVEWKTDTTKTILSILAGDNAIELNKRFQVEIGYHIFRFAPEDYPEDFGCLIGARKISYSLS
jgi:hypothetical protein